MTRTAGARKSLGEYKPLMIEELGFKKRTEVLGQRGRLEKVAQQTVFYGGPGEIWHAERGLTFKTRDEAIAYAQSYIDRLEARHAERVAAYEARHR